MQLNVQSWGQGPRTAVLIHGLSDDASTWWRVAPALVAEGFTVLAPELRGHGRSPRATRYAPADFGADLVDTLHAGADLVLGHSLGALALGLVADQLAPRATVYVDPPWFVRRGRVDLSAQVATTPEELGAAGWSAQDVDVDLRSNALLDPALGAALMAAVPSDGEITPPAAGTRDTLVMVPAAGAVLPTSSHPTLRSLGYRVTQVPRAGHVIHRDNFDSFVAVLLDHLRRLGVAA